VRVDIKLMMGKELNESYVVSGNQNRCLFKNIEYIYKWGINHGKNVRKGYTNKSVKINRSTYVGYVRASIHHMYNSWRRAGKKELLYI
jgi:hypothetical protein